MKVRLLKKLRKEAREKYTLEVHRINDTVDYRIMMNTDKKSSVMYHSSYINHAIEIRNKLRNNDILKNVGILRYKHFMKRYK